MDTREFIYIKNNQIIVHHVTGANDVIKTGSKLPPGSALIHEGGSIWQYTRVKSKDGLWNAPMSEIDPAIKAYMFMTGLKYD